MIGACLDEIVRRRPDAIALRSDTSSFTYGELSQLAEGTCELLSGAEGPVGLLFHHGPESVVAITAALRSGRLYVPLDPSAAFEYLQGVVQSARPSTLLCEESTVSLGQRLNIPVEKMSPKKTPGYRAPEVLPDSLSSLIFTSGTTGDPKGVAESHRTLYQAATSLAESLQISAESRMAGLVSYAFGASSLNVTATMLQGGAVCFYDLAKHGFRGLPHFIASHQITHLPLTPTGFRALVTQARKADLSCVKWLKLAGEPLTPADLELYRRHFPPSTRISYVYGSSEAREICGLEIEHDSVFQTTIPVGYPRPERTVTLSDTGEIVVESAFLTPGYWDGERAVRSARFEGDRFYTGDLGELDELGRLHLLGRADDQVKVGGRRVELRGVENTFRSHPDVLDVVAAVESGVLTAHLVVRGRPDLRSLADSHQPRPELIFWPEFPLLSNGKVDRKALAERPSAGGLPENHMEASVLSHCREVFGQNTIGMEDRIVLDSLASAELLTRVGREFGCDLPLAVFADGPTVRELSGVVAKFAESEKRWPLTVDLQLGSRPTFYCLPGAGYDPVVLLRLVRLLDPEQPLRSFRPLGIHDPELRPTGVEDLAAIYVQELKQSLGEGPILLGGSSFGGLVAFEMALQLEQQGYPVAGLVMFDTYGPGFPVSRDDLTVLRKALLFLIELLPISERGEWNARAIWSAIWFRLKLLFGRKVEVQSHAHRYHHLTVSQVLMGQRYRPAGVFAGPSLLVRTESRVPEAFYQLDRCLGWDSLLSSLEVADMPGRHTEHLLEPNVGYLARAVQHFLDRYR